MITTLLLQDYPFQLLRALFLSPKCLLNFLSNLYIPPWVGKIFKFMVFTFLENALNLDIFIHVPLHSKLAPRFLSSHPRQKEICHSLRQHFFENIFPRTAESGGGNYDLLYQNSIRKYEHELKLRQGFYMVISRYIKRSLTTLQNLDLFYQQ